jgi:hypothetical protein
VRLRALSAVWRQHNVTEMRGEGRASVADDALHSFANAEAASNAQVRASGSKRIASCNESTCRAS